MIRFSSQDDLVNVVEFHLEFLDVMLGADSQLADI